MSVINVNEIPLDQFGTPVNQGPKFGDLLVGRSFNPSDDVRVDRVKEICSELAEILKDSYQTSDRNPVTSIIFDQAVGSILSAQMLVVKVITFKNPEDATTGEKSTD
jgi:hypothetical protein